MSSDSITQPDLRIGFECQRCRPLLQLLLASGVYLPKCRGDVLQCRFTKSPSISKLRSRLVVAMEIGGSKAALDDLNIIGYTSLLAQKVPEGWTRSIPGTKAPHLIARLSNLIIKSTSLQIHHQHR